jgi:hypothetical protein
MIAQSRREIDGWGVASAEVDSYRGSDCPGLTPCLPPLHDWRGVKIAVVPLGLGQMFNFPGAEAPGYWQTLLRSSTTVTPFNVPP